MPSSKIVAADAAGAGAVASSSGGRLHSQRLRFWAGREVPSPALLSTTHLLVFVGNGWLARPLPYVSLVLSTEPAGEKKNSDRVRL